MTTLILDRFSQQSLLKRSFSYLLTSMGWGFWTYLWLPLLEAMVILATHQNASLEASAALSSLQGLMNTLSTHMVTIACVVAVFLLWAILQWLGKHSRLLAIQKQQATTLPYSSMHHIKQWQAAQCMVVSHDDTTGLIKRVQILKNENT